MKLLDEAGQMEEPHGRLSIGILLVQDVLVVVVLTALGGSAGATASGPLGVVLPFVAMAGLVVVGLAVGRWFLPGVVRWLAPVPQGLFIVGLAWAFGFIVASEVLHLSVELGAFIAGVILAQVPHTEELRRRTHPLVDFFLAVFFVSLGARMEGGAMATAWPAALITAAFVLLVKPGVVAVILGLLGRRRETAALTGLTLGQVSEFAFILAGLALARGLVTDGFFGYVGLVGLITIGTSAVLVPAGDAVVQRLRTTGVLGWLPGKDAEAGDAPPLPMENHVVVVGINTLGRMLVRRFVELGEPVLAVDTDATKLVGLAARSLVGDVTRTAVFEEAGIPRARLVVSALQIEDVNSLVAYRCARLGVPTSIHAFDTSMVDELLEMGVDYVMVSKSDGIRSMEEGLVRLGVLG